MSATSESAAAPPRPWTRRLLAFVLVFAAAAPFVFFLFFLIRGGWLAISVALVAFPSSLIWLALNSVPQGAVVGLFAGLVPERWATGGVAAAAFLLGGAMAMANSLWLGLALIDPPTAPANLAAVGLIGGLSSLLIALALSYVLRPKGMAR